MTKTVFPSITEAIALSAYGITPDTGDDLTTEIQTVIDDNPGRKILFDRAGTYLVNTSTLNTLRWCLLVRTDNTQLLGVPGAELKTTQNAALVFFAGVFKQGIVTNWATAGHANRTWMPKLAVHNLTGTYAKGATSITLATASDAGAYAAGDIIFIRTGQTITFTGNDQPDAEMNKVVSADAGTGVITLQYPLSKPYAQEYFPAADTGPSTTTVTAFPVTYGTVNVSNYVLNGCGIKGLKLTADSLTDQNIIDIYHAWDFEQSDCEIHTNRNSGVTWGMRFGRVLRNRITLTGVGLYYFLWPGATTQNDIECAYNEGWCAGIGQIHIHEGGANLRVHHNRLRNVGIPASDNHAISIRGRGYDIVIDHNDVSGTGQFYLLFTDTTVTGGLLIDANVFDAGVAVGVAQLSDSSHRFLSSNKILNGWVSARNPNGLAFTDGFTSGVQTIQNWVTDDNQNPSLGTRPAYSTVLRVHVHVTQAFNSSTTDELTVGYDADPDSLATTVDVSTTGVKTVTLGVGAGYSDTARAVEAYYVNGGTEPTTGRALVIVEYVQSHREVT